MDCPYCDYDLTMLVREYWSGIGSENFKLICPSCGNSVTVSVELTIEITMDEVQSGLRETNMQVTGMFNGI